MAAARRRAIRPGAPGTELGLYIVARYLELMGGRIALQSRLGQGTAVTIKLPLTTPD